MVRDIFSIIDASIITSIPHSRISTPDKLIWKDSNIGLFIVKLAYFAARCVMGKKVHQQNLRSNVWGTLWKAKVVLKIKHFVWRLVHGILPSGA